MSRKSILTVSDPQDRVSRSEVLGMLTKDTLWDVAIVGGGIHGGAVAGYLSSAGFKTVLLERDDYASATSSRSSKMAHGGLRYLEMFDFEQVFEGIRAREELFETAFHLVRPAKFLIPVSRRQWWFRAKLALGLRLYDFFVKKPERRHRWIPRRELSFEGFSSDRLDLMGCFEYTDGILNDTRLVFEQILSARRTGAVCLNHLEVTALSEKPKERIEVSWTDGLSKEQGVLSARLVVNCAGPWAPFVQSMNDRAQRTNTTVKYSRGTHLLFSRLWTGPSLFLPMEGKARYYFVWPHPGGTMVGTTEQQVETLERDPQPLPEEVDRILSRVEQDLPKSGLNRESLHYAFAGVRTLPLRDSAKSVATLSRKHIWKRHGRVLSLFGGKFTTFRWTAREGASQAAALLGKPETFDLERGGSLPGAAGFERSVGEFREFSTKRQVPPKVIERAICRYGSRVSSFLSDEAIEVLGGNCLRGELDMALEVEQAETLEDVVRRRLDLEYEPGNGMKALPEIAAALRELRSERDVAEELAAFRERITRLTEVLTGTQKQSVQSVATQPTIR